MKKILKLALFNIIALTIAACSTKRISERKLVNILAEMHTIDAFITENNSAIPTLRGDSTAIYAPILAKYGATMPQVYSAMERYTSNKEKMAELYEKVVRTLEKTEKKYALPPKNSETMKIDSINNVK